MATAAVIAAAAVSAAATAGSAAYSASQGGPSAPGAPRVTKIPQTPEQRGLQQYYSRLLASNATTVGPSFNEYVMSGGKARMPLVNTGLSPREAELLGIVDNHGKPIPFGDVGTISESGLTEDQQRNLGKAERRAGEIHAPLVRALDWEQNIGRLQKKLDAGVGPNREEHIMRRIENMNDRITRLRRL